MANCSVDAKLGTDLCEKILYIIHYIDIYVNNLVTNKMYSVYRELNFIYVGTQENILTIIKYIIIYNFLYYFYFHFITRLIR